jgi:hypothetical protein
MDTRVNFYYVATLHAIKCYEEKRTYKLIREFIAYNGVELQLTNADDIARSKIIYGIHDNQVSPVS